jgi:Gpi18-like mannosyltransferase
MTPGVLSPGDERRAWHHSALVALAAYVVSRACVAAGASVRAAQRVADANRFGRPRPGSGGQLIADVLTSWDGLWYLRIVRDGYPRSVPADISYFQDEARAAFFPLYPLTVRAVDRVLPFGDTFAALTLNVVLGLAGMLLVGEIALRVADPDVALKAMMLFAFFPGSFVLSFAYAEALMIVLAAACLLFLLDRRWERAGVAAALATATRPNGIAVVAACAVAACFAVRERREWRALVAPLLAPIGFVVFQLAVGAQTGERGVWFRVQREAWQEGTSFGSTAIENTFGFLTSPLSSPTDALTAISMVAMLGALWALWKRRLPASLVAYVAVVLALMLVPATVTARPRFLFTAFPLVIPVAGLWPQRDRFGWDLLMVSCGAGLAVLTTLYGVFGAIP